LPVKQAKYAIQERLGPTVAPLTAAVSLALGASSLQAAVITVDTLADSAPAPDECSLRRAFEAAETDSAVAGCSAGSGADEIVFDASLTGTIALSTPPIYVDSEVTLNGPGAGTITISGSGVNRLFGVAGADADLTIRGVTLADAYTDQSYGGAAVAALTSSSLTLEDCIVTGNTTSNDGLGGAIAAFGSSLTIDNCDFYGNSNGGSITRGVISPAYTLGGAVLSELSPSVSITDSYFGGNIAGYSGGAIAIIGGNTVTLDSIEVENNEASTGGGIALVGGARATLSNSIVSANRADAGGGVLVADGARLYAYDVEFDANEADFDGAGVLSGTSASPGETYLSGATFTNNLAGRFGGGAAAKYEGSILTASESLFAGNAAGTPTSIPIRQDSAAPFGISRGKPAFAGGGAVAAVEEGVINFIDGSEAVSNQAAQGGGVLAYGGTAYLSDARIADNLADSGGGVQSGAITTGTPVARGTLASNGFALVIDSIVSGNEAESGGGLATVYDASLILSQSTVDDNTAASGAGMIAYYADFSVKYSTISDNTATGIGGGITVQAPGCESTIRDTVISGNSGLFGGLFVDECGITIEGSTIAGNNGYIAGGAALYGEAFAPPRLINSTITSNTGAQVGGLLSGGLEASFVTISHNTATATRNAELAGPRGVVTVPAGGAFLNDSVNAVTIDSAILSDNTAASGTNDLEIDGSASLDYSLVEAPGGGLPTGTGNLIGLDPGLGALTDNGGDTPTRALGQFSIAVDAANPSTPLTSDQRGGLHPREFGGRADMGAYEFFIDEIFSDRFEQP
jgi:hypothetical protein